MEQTLVGGAIAIVSGLIASLIAHRSAVAVRREERQAASQERWRERSAGVLASVSVLLSDVDFLLFVGLRIEGSLEKAHEAEATWLSAVPPLTELALLHPDSAVRSKANDLLKVLRWFMANFALLTEEEELGKDLGLHGDLSRAKKQYESVPAALENLAEALRGK